MLEVSKNNKFETYFDNEKYTISPPETIYGTKNRLYWIKKFLTKQQLIIDIGCGTGSMITIPLLLEGYNVIGYDLDQASIDFGKKLLKKYNLNTNLLRCENVETLEDKPDIIVLSQVLEHLNNTNLDTLFRVLYKMLKKDGLVLITVPNGYGFFEFESFLWYKMKLGKLFGLLKVTNIILRLKNYIWGKTKEEYISSLDSSPHVQRFTYYSLEKKLKEYGFSCYKKQGGSLICGPFSNLLFTGIKSVMKLNIWMGKLFPIIASDFYVAAKKIEG